MADDEFAPLGAELRRLVPPGPEPDDAFAAAVLTRIAARPEARPGAWEGFTARLRDRRRRLAVVGLVATLALTGVPAVRAQVSQWFSFSGVEVDIRPGPAPSGTPSPPPAAASGLTVERAAALVAFRPVLLGALGAPDGVEVSADRRVLSLSWDDPRAGTIRLDQFDGTLDYAFAKQATGAEWVDLDGGDPALWFEVPHEVSVLDAAGRPRVEPARLAGHTLIWDRGGTALRLEGDLPRDRAVEVARSAQPLR